MRSEKFSSNEDIRATLNHFTGKEGGPILHTEDGELYVYDKEGHIISIGMSGTGKSRRFSIPFCRTLIDARESVIVVDPKGEIWNKCSRLASKHHRVHCVNLREPARSNSWNALGLPHDLFSRGEKNQARQLAQEAVFNITNTSRTFSDKFWQDSERSLLLGVISLMLEFAPKEGCNFTNALAIIQEDWDSLDHSSYETIKGGLLNDIHELLPAGSPTRQLLSAYTSLAARNTRSCVYSECANTLSKFATTEDIVALTSNDDLNIADLDADKPFAIFIIIPDEAEGTFSTLAGLLVSQLSQRLIKLADTKYNGKLPIRVNFILEELGQIGGAISQLPYLMAASRSRNIRSALVLQSLSQLETIYGPTKGQTIQSNADITICFRTSCWNTLSEFSRKCGEKTIKAGDIKFTQELLSPCQLGAMTVGQALIFISGRIKYVVNLPDFTEMFPGDDMVELPLPVTKNEAEHKSFGLVEIRNSILPNSEGKSKSGFYIDKLFPPSSCAPHSSSPFGSKGSHFSLPDLPDFPDFSSSFANDDDDDDESCYSDGLFTPPGVPGIPRTPRNRTRRRYPKRLVDDNDYRLDDVESKTGKLSDRNMLYEIFKYGVSCERFLNTSDKTKELIDVFDETGESVRFNILSNIVDSGVEYLILTPYVAGDDEHDMDSDCEYDLYVLQVNPRQKDYFLLLELVEDEPLISKVVDIYKEQQPTTVADDVNDEDDAENESIFKRAIQRLFSDGKRQVNPKDTDIEDSDDDTETSK